MLPNWKEKKLTLVAIPGANARFRQFRLPLLWAYLISAAVFVIAVGAAALVLLHGLLVDPDGPFKAGRAGGRESLERTVAVKDHEIERLQSELLKLVAETNHMRTKVNDLKHLEQKLQSAAKPENHGKQAAAPAAGAVDASKTGILPDSPARSAGGEPVPAETEDYLKLSRSSRYSLQSLGDETARLQASLQRELNRAERLAYINSITPSIFPTKSTQITSAFGYRKDPFTRRSAFHRGIDISGSVNDPVRATASGVVRRTGYDRSMGNYVFLDHGNGMETIYMHLNKVIVKKGQRVKKRETIGLLGSTGRSTGPHLHYEVHKDGKATNPKLYLR